MAMLNYSLWFQAFRPATLWAAVVPIIVATALAVAHHVVHWGVVAVCLCTALALQVACNLVNDVADADRGADTEHRLGPVRVTQRGLIERAHVQRAAWLALTVACVLGSVLVLIGGWPIACVGLLSLLAAYAYTGGPWPLGYYGWGDVLVFLFFGIVAVCGTFYLQAHYLTQEVVCAGSSVGFLCTAILIVNNLRDRDTDALVHKKTLAVRWGALFARWEYTACVLLPYGIVLAVVLYDREKVGWLLSWLSFPIAMRAIVALHREDGVALNPWLGKTAQLELIFGCLLAVGVLL